MREYFLPPHVFVSVLDETYIWLDTRLDKFRGTSKKDCQGLGALVEGWPKDDGDDCEGHANANARDIAESLVRQGLLTRNAGQGKTAAMPILQQPLRSLNGESEAPRQVTRQHRVRFLVAYLKTVVTFKLSSLSLALAVVANRKMAHSERSLCVNTEESRELVDVFMRLRLRFYTARRRCLFDSLTLVHFLAAYRIYPDLVIGVAESPFRAHSWVQQSGAVLNYDFEYVKEFHPVVVI